MRIKYASFAAPWLLIASLLFAITVSSGGASASSHSVGTFFFSGASTTSGDIAVGRGTTHTSSVNGLGAVYTSGGENAAIFSLTGLLSCSPPPRTSCLGLQGTVIATIGAGINGARVGDPVIVILVETGGSSGSTCIILPVPGTCDNFVGIDKIS